MLLHSRASYTESHNKLTNNKSIQKREPKKMFIKEKEKEKMNKINVEIFRK